VREALRGLKDPGPYKTPTGPVAKIVHLIAPGEDAGDVWKRLGQKVKNFNLVRLRWDRPSYTITKTIRTAQAGLLHPDENRFLGINELKRLASFPDEFKFVGPYEKQWARIGNCVPPNMMRAIAEHIRDHILAKINETGKVV